jgi:hypothetical protein
MATRKTKTAAKRIWGPLATLVLMLAIGAVVVFQTDLIGLKKGSSYDDKLLPSVKITGTIKAEDLKLTDKEITSLNNLSRSYGDLFSTMNMNLVLENKYAPILIEHGTTMILTLTCSAQDSEVVFRSREVKRSELVKHMKRSMEKAEAEFKRYREGPGGKQFKRLVI